MSEFTKSAALTGARLGAAMTRMTVLCGGQSLSLNSQNLDESIVALLLPIAEAGGCTRSADVFRQEVRYAADRVKDAMKEAQRQELIEAWKDRYKKQFSQEELEALLKKHTQATSSTGTFQAKVDPIKNPTGTIRYTLFEETKWKSSSSTSALTNVEKDLFKIISQPDMAANSFRTAGVNSVMRETQQLEAALKAVYDRSSPNFFNPDKAATELKSLAEKMGTIARRSPYGANVQSMARSISNAVSSGGVCSARNDRLTPLEIWWALIHEKAFAGSICSIDQLVRSSGRTAAADAAALRTGLRGALGRAAAVAGPVGWAALIVEGQEALANMAKDKFMPCEQISNYYPPAKWGSRYESVCPNTMSLDSLARPLGKNPSFFDLSDDDQKKQFETRDFCRLFDKVFDEQLGQRKASCQSGGKIKMENSATKVTHEIDLDEIGSVKELRTYGSGVPRSSILRFDETESPLEITLYSGSQKTRENNQTSVARDGLAKNQKTFTMTELRGPPPENDSRYFAQPIAAMATAFLNAGSIMEVSGCCTGVIGADDSLGRCRDVQNLPSKSSGSSAVSGAAGSSEGSHR